MFASISSLLSHRYLTFVAAAVCFSVLLVSPKLGLAQFAQQGAKLVGTGAVGNARQGSVAVSADGNTAIVGGAGDNSGVGAAWVFTRSGGVWTQQGSKLVGLSHPHPRLSALRPMERVRSLEWTRIGQSDSVRTCDRGRKRSPTFPYRSQFQH
jgi:hypothetical protein